MTERNEWRGWTYFQEGYQQTSALEGKYLFFSKNRESLLAIAEEAVDDDLVLVAKVSSKTRGFPELVCCLYAENESMAALLHARWGGCPGIKFAGWKTNKQTRKDWAPGGRLHVKSRVKPRAVGPEPYRLPGKKENWTGRRKGRRCSHYLENISDEDDHMLAEAMGIGPWGID